MEPADREAHKTKFGVTDAEIDEYEELLVAMLNEHDQEKRRAIKGKISWSIFKKKKDLVEHPEIPVGVYCYKTIGVDPVTKKRQTYLCPHWSSKDVNGPGGAHCSLLNVDSESCDPTNLIWIRSKNAL